MSHSEATRLADPTAATGSERSTGASVLQEVDPSHGARLIEIGLVVAGHHHRTSLAAVHKTRDTVLERLRETFPEFEWRIDLVQRPEISDGPRVEPVLILQQGVEQRHDQEWDFVVILTAADLVSHYKPFALASVSRALDAAVISTARIAPQVTDASAPHEQCADQMASHLVILTLHALGHLSGLGHSGDAHNLMNDIESLDEMAVMEHLDELQKATMTQSLREIADLRLEEQDAGNRRRPVQFVFRSVWLNRREILDAIHQAHPWEFPIRLSRLTTAAVSTVVILMMTAETWDLAMNQTPWRVAALLLASLVVTTIYVVQRQQLLVRRNRRRLTEQIVITNVAALSIVATGMLTTYLSLFLATFAATTLYPETLISAWAATVDPPIGPADYCLLAGFVSSIGIVIGSLGASFEEQHHFRHITFVDEET